MKRFLILVLACALALSACGNDTVDKNSGTPSDTVLQESEVSESKDPDSEKVAQAYLSGDRNGLNEMETELLALAENAVGEFYSQGMSEVEICLAAHDWIVTNTTYDVGTLAVIPKATPYSDCAYGVLKSGVGICSGYTGTFKLFMDMLGVENTVVSGAAATAYINGEPDAEEHAWNMVCIDDKWYHIDCTWDDFVPDYDDRPAYHIYTLVSDDEMDKSGHIWDKESAPKAQNDDLNYYKTHGLYANTTDEAVEMIKKAVASGARYAEIAVATPFVDIMYEGVSSWATIFDGYYVLALTIYR